MKKLLIFFAIMFVLCATTIALASEGGFEDVPDSHWAHDDIMYLMDKGAVSGDGSGRFNPENTITKEEFVKMVVTTLGIPEGDASLGFKDVKSGAWYTSYLKSAVASGIITGKSKDEFGIGEGITRQDACVILSRAMTNPGEYTEVPGFADKDTIAPYAIDAVSKLASSGIISGFPDNTFRPEEICTRAQGARIIKKAIEKENSFFDGARKIVFMGDSITNAAEYVIYINAFLKTRFPNEKIEVIFAGNDGDTLKDMMLRYEDDVVAKGATEAFILFGGNDVSRSLYPSGSQEAKDKAIDTAKNNLETLITMLKSDGINNITLLTAPCFDEREYEGASANSRAGASEGLGRISQNTIEVANKYGLKYVDLYALTTKITNAKKNSNKVEIFKTDRIHPNRVGHFVMANEIIQSLYKSNSLVASVEVDTANKTIKSNNANVSDLAVDGDVISYTYNAKCLPMGIDTKDITEGVAGNGYSDAEELYPEFVDFTDKMNQEIIKVKGLAEGSYEIAFDGKVIGTFGHDELNRGVNIAILSENPGQIKAKAVIDSFMKNYWTQTKVRRCETRFTILKKHGMMQSSKADITAWVDSTYPNGNGQRPYWTSFLGMYEDYDIFKAQWDRLERNAYNLAKPGTHKVTVTKAQ